MDINKKIPDRPGRIVAPPIQSPLATQMHYVSAAPYNAEDTGASDEGSSFLAYWNFLVRHKTTILLSALGGLVLGFAVGIPMKPMFRARTSIEVLALNEDFMNGKQSNPTTTADYSDEVSEEETQAELIQGSALLHRVTSELDPDAPPPGWKPPMARVGWRSWLHLPEAVVPTARQKLLAKAVDSLKVRVRPRTRVLEITANSIDPQFAADFLNTLVQQFVLQSVEARLSTTERTGAWLKHEIDGARANLKRSEEALQTYARSSGLIFTDNEAETNVATERLQQLQLSLSNATTDRIAKESRFELAKNSPPNSLADVLNDDGLQGIEEKINETSRKLADLNAVYTPDYLGVKRAQAELAELQSAFQNKRSNIIQKITTDFHQAEKNEGLLEKSYVAQAREVSGQDERAVQYNILKREVESNRQLYDTMLQQMKQASIASALRASNLRVVDAAMPEQIPVFPNFKLNSVLGLFAALIISIVLLTARDRADRTLQMPGDIKQWTSLPELGTIPIANIVGRQAGYSAYNALPGGRGGAKSGKKLFSATIDRNDPVELMTHHQKPSLVAEAFRSTLTSILFMAEDGTRPRVLVLTSTHPGDGKTTVVSNIGIALAEIRSKTLIIDADLRRPRMHKIFDLQNDRGLADLLAEEMSDEHTANLIQESGIPGLHVLTGGVPASYTAAHLLHSPNLRTFLEKAKLQYDMILIDTPPVTNLTDARVIGRLSDATIFVARAGKTTRDALLVAKERFEGDHTLVLGTILNSWDPMRHTSSYQYTKYRDYSSSYVSDPKANAASS